MSAGMHHPDDAALVRACDGIEARLPRLRQAAADAQLAYDEASVAAAMLPDQHARRAARAANQELCARMLAKQAEASAETAALATAQRRLAEQREARDEAELAATVAAEKLACGVAVQSLHDAAVAFSRGMDALAALYAALDGAVVVAWQQLPALTKASVAFKLNAGARLSLTKQMLADRGLVAGPHSMMDATARHACMEDIFVLPELAELLPAADDDEPERIAA